MQTYEKHPSEKSTIVLVGALALSITTIIVLIIMLIAARDLHLQTLERVDKPIELKELPGPKGTISDRSKHELSVILAETPHIIGGWVTRLEYGKTENPVLYYWAGDPIVETAMRNYATMQTSGKGFSSAELNAQSSQSLRNSEEAKSGLIACGVLSQTNLSRLAPGIEKKVNGVCRATIPPFDENVNLAIVVVISADGDQNTPEVQTIRRSLLQLQIDIFNRDYRGRETWARE